MNPKAVAGRARKAEAAERKAAEAEAAALVSGLTTSIAEPDEPVQVETTDSGTLAITADDEAGRPQSSPAISVTLKILNDITDLCERFSKYVTTLTLLH